MSYPQASKRNSPEAWLWCGGLTGLGVFLLCGCELVQAFFFGAGQAAADAAPEITEDALSGNWLSAAVGLVVTAIVGGVLEVKRRKRKRELKPS